MNRNSKIEKLRSLDEATLRESVLVPLLARMNFKAVTVYHGPQERGKDIICFDYDRLGAREYLAIVAKATRLTGNVSSSQSLQAVLFQIQQCFSVPYENLFDMARVSINKVWIVASDSISSGAEVSVFSQLEQSNLSKLVRFVAVENLAELIDQHYPAYWDSSLEPSQVIEEQKNRLMSFASQLLLALGGDPHDVDATMQQVVNSPHPPQVRAARNRFVSGVSPYNVEIDTIDPEYAHDFWTVNYGLIRPLYLKAKKETYYAMFDLVETIDHYDDFIAKVNPHEVAEVFDAKLSSCYPFYRATYGRASDAIEAVEYLRGAAEEIDTLRVNLRKIEKLDWATSLVDSVAALKKEIEAFIEGVSDEAFRLYWRIETTNGRGRLCMLYGSADHDPDVILTTEHKKTVNVGWRQPQHTRQITVSDVFEKIQEAIRKHFDQVLVRAGIVKKEESR